MTRAALNSEWTVTVLFLLALALLCMVMKLAALVVTRRGANRERRLFVTWPVLSPISLQRRQPLSAAPGLAVRAVTVLGVMAAYYWFLAVLRGAYGIPGWALSYLGAPIVLMMGEGLAALLTVAWPMGGWLLPPLHNRPLLARGLDDFWGRRWNLWFSDWFRQVLFHRARGRSGWRLLQVFFVSGLMHEGVVNLPLWAATGKNRFGLMMVYFLLQGAGTIFEHRCLKDKPGARRLWVWLVVLGPAPLMVNEGLLRALHVWPQ